MEEIKVQCNRNCLAKANDGIHCMWKVDERLIQLASDGSYHMCGYLRKKALSIVNGDSGIKQLATEALIEMGAPINTKGCKYIIDAIGVIDSLESSCWKVCDIYEAVAQENDAKWPTVERCIRNALERILTKGNLECVEKYLSLVNITNGSQLHTFYYRLTH